MDVIDLWVCLYLDYLEGESMEIAKVFKQLCNENNYVPSVLLLLLF